MLLLAGAALLGGLGDAHFTMMVPASWHLGNSYDTTENPHTCPNYACEWYTNWTRIDTEPTIPLGSPLLTYQPYDGWYDWTRDHPWRHPGKAPITASCGWEGGNPQGCLGGDCAGGGYPFGPSGDYLAKGITTHWEAGGTADVAWGLTANHGGGYAYRLCRLPEDGDRTKLTEACFQQHTLEYATSTHTVYTSKDATAQVIPALRTSEGTHPVGATYTRNPIPAGGTTSGQGAGYQFEPPCEGCHGFVRPSDFMVWDTVRVPDLPAGEYVLSMRFDCEQTAQVWSQCATVRIVESGGPVPAPVAAPRCGSAGHCGVSCSDPNNHASCAAFISNSMCTLGKAHCDCSEDPGVDPFPCCQGTWFEAEDVPVAPDRLCESDAGACGYGCRDGNEGYENVPQCQAWTPNAYCIASQGNCEGVCGGKWFAAAAPTPEPTPAPIEPTAAPVAPTAAPIEPTPAPTAPPTEGPSCGGYGTKRACRGDADCCWKKTCRAKADHCPKQKTAEKCGKFGCDWDALQEVCGWAGAAA